MLFASQKIRTDEDEDAAKSVGEIFNSSLFFQPQIRIFLTFYRIH